MSDRTYIAGVNVETCFTGYLEAALWSSSDTDPATRDEHGDGRDVPLDEWPGDIDPDALRRMREDVVKFLEAVETDGQIKCGNGSADDIFDEAGDATVGRDLWLTAAHHGCGFWDGDYPTNGDRLTSIVRETVNREDGLYIGDDGVIYLY